MKKLEKCFKPYYNWNTFNTFYQDIDNNKIKIEF